MPRFIIFRPLARYYSPISVYLNTLSKHKGSLLGSLVGIWKKIPQYAHRRHARLSKVPHRRLNYSSIFAISRICKGGMLLRYETRRETAKCDETQGMFTNPLLRVMKNVGRSEDNNFTERSISVMCLVAVI